jgi:hypothetical protein
MGLYEVRTYAGSGALGSLATPGSVNGVGTNALLASPYDLVYDPAGCWYVAELGSSMIRKINDTTLNATCLAGSPYDQGTDDGIGTNAKFSLPAGLALTPAADILFVADQGFGKIRSISLSTRQVTTLAGSTDGYADGFGTNAKFSYPTGLVYLGGLLYISDQFNNAIRILNVSSGQVSTFAGDTTAGSADGVGTNARLNYPAYMALDTPGWL